MRKTKAYKEGYEYALKCGRYEEEWYRDDWSEYIPYRKELKTEKKKYSDFLQGRDDAIQYMKKINLMIIEASYLLKNTSFDRMFETVIDYYAVISACENEKQVAKLVMKYDEGIAALRKLHNDVVLKIPYFLM